MKKRILLIALILIVVGIVIGLIGLSTIDFDVRRLSIGGTYVQKTFESAQSLSKIVIDDDNSKINIVKTLGTSFSVSYEENEKEKYNIKIENNSLIIESENNYKWYDYIAVFDFQDREVTVYVPADFKGEIDAETENGRMEISDLEVTTLKMETQNGSINLKNTISTVTELETRNGGIYLENVTATTLKAETSNGAYHVKNVTADTFEVSTSNGSINIEDITVTGDLNAKTTNGSINLTTVKAKTILAKTANSGIDLKNVTSDSEIYAETSNGKIVLTSVKFETKGTFRSSNGSIRGTIIGSESDFKYICNTDNGECNLPNDFGSGSKLLTIKTRNGDIEVNIVD